MDRDEARTLDAEDELAWLRDRFVLPDDVIYLDGNSLGALPRTVAVRLARTVVREWGQRLIRSWNEAGWWDVTRVVAAKLAALLGAEDGEIAVADSTSVNLFKLIVAGHRLRPGRPVIVVERSSFPTDIYIAREACELIGGELRLLDEPAGLQETLDERVALVVLNHVDFRTGAMWDAPVATEQVRDSGALMLWDVCHSVGALDVDMRAWGADMAVGCGYKYLNGGPGAPAFAYVARKHHAGLRTPLPGWTGHAEPFAMSPDYRPAPEVGQLQSGTTPLLGLVALDEALSALDRVSSSQLRAKGKRLTSVFIEQLGDLPLASPRDAERRGSQVSVRHPEAYALVQALIARGVIGDFRQPDIARFGFAPAYLRFVDAWDAAHHVLDVLRTGEHRDERFARRATVT